MTSSPPPHAPTDRPGRPDNRADEPDHGAPAPVVEVGPRPRRRVRTRRRDTAPATGSPPTTPTTTPADPAITPAAEQGADPWCGRGRTTPAGTPRTSDGRGHIGVTGRGRMHLMASAASTARPMAAADVGASLTRSLTEHPTGSAEQVTTERDLTRDDLTRDRLTRDGLTRRVGRRGPWAGTDLTPPVGTGHADTGSAPRPPIPIVAIWDTSVTALPTELGDESGAEPGRQSAAFDPGHTDRTPERVTAWAINRYSQPRGLVVDPDCGHGQVLAAALRAGRHGVGASGSVFDLRAARETLLGVQRAGASADAVLCRRLSLLAQRLTGQADLLITRPRPHPAPGARRGDGGPRASLLHLSGLLASAVPLLHVDGYAVITVEAGGPPWAPRDPRPDDVTTIARTAGLALLAHHLTTPSPRPDPPARRTWLFPTRPTPRPDTVHMLVFTPAPHIDLRQRVAHQPCSPWSGPLDDSVRPHPTSSAASASGADGDGFAAPGTSRRVRHAS